MRLFKIFAPFLILAACSTDLTTEGAQVRQISAATSNSCEFLGPITGAESMGLDVAMDVQSAYNKLRNNVAARGGNAFVVSSTSTSNEITVVQGDAYRC